MPLGKNLFDYGTEYKIDFGNGLTGTLTGTSLQGISIQKEGPTPDIPKPIQNIDLGFRYDIDCGGTPTLTVYNERVDLMKKKEKIKEKEKEKENMNKYDELLNLYENKMKNKINEKYDELTEQLCIQDKIQIIIAETQLRMETELKELGESQELIDEIYNELDNVIYLTSKTNEKIDELRINQDTELNELYDTLKEVKARLAMTDDYDTQMKILKEYNITNKNGKLNI